MNDSHVYNIVVPQTYSVTVNGAAVGTYQAGAIVTVDGTQDDKVFQQWSAAEGLANGLDDLSSQTDAVVTFTMPEGDVNLTADYVSRISAVTLTVDKPVAGQPLPTKGTLSWGEGEDAQLPVSVYWVEQVNGGTQTASGTAKYGTSYSVAALVSQKVSNKGIVFNANLSKNNAQVFYVDQAGNGDNVVYNAYIDAAGDLRIFGDQVTTAYPKVTSVSAGSVTICKDTPLEDLKAALPETALVKAEDGSVRKVPLTYSDDALSKIDLGNTGERTLNATIDYANIPVLPDNHDTAEVKIYVYAIGTVAAPTAIQEGSEITLSCETEDASIQYQLDGDSAYQDYTGPIQLDCPKGETKTFTITARATKSSLENSPDVTFTYVLDDPFTVTIYGKDTGLKGELWTKTYSYHKDDTVTIAAPGESDELFDHWESVPSGVTGESTDNVLSVDSLQDDLTLTAVYTPVVKKLELTMDVPSLGSALSDQLTSATATVTDPYDVKGLFSDISWSPALPANGKPAYNTTYTAKLTLRDTANFNFLLSEHLTLNVNGSNSGLIARVAQENDSYAIYVTFPKTDKVGLVSVQQPDNISATRQQAAGGSYSLPGSTILTLADGSQCQAGICSDEWSVGRFDPNNLNAQTLTATNNVTVPDDVSQGQVSTTVTFQILVPAAEQVQAPTANILSGTYGQAQSVRLSCATEGAAIYYTLDGTTPTTASTRYDGGVISITNTAQATELRAIAVQDGLRDSILAVYRYEIQPGADPVKPDGPGKSDDSDHGSSGRDDSDTPTTPSQPSQDYTSCDRGTGCPLRQFADLDPYGWYHNGIHFCLDQKLMSGYGNKRFGPNDAVTRGQIVTVLWRLAGAADGESDLRFADVADSAWYAQAVRWAADTGVVSGYGDGRFGPDDTVTREQLAVMFRRFVQLQQQDADKTGDLSAFSDRLSVSPWALDAVQWACGAGLISGTDKGQLLPQGSATRAQAAAMLQRLCETLKK